MRRDDRRSTARRARASRAVLSAALLLPLLIGASAGTEPLEGPIVFCQLPADRAPAEARAGGMLPAEYGEGARLKLLQPDGGTVDLAPDFASACDPDVSFDGRRILFAGQRSPGDPWDIWEMRADGTEIRRITNETGGARHPIYLATFYTITSSEPWYTILFVGEDGALNETATAPGTSLYTVRLDGTERRRITFHPGNDRTPFLMRDGRLLFAGWRLSPRSGEPTGRLGLYGVQTDGIDYAAYGGSQGLRVQHMPTATRDGTVVFVEAERLSWDGAGRLAAVDASRPHHSYRPLGGGEDGLFHSPAPLADGTLLVSQRRPGGVLRIVRYSLSEGVLAVLHELPGHHSFHARAVAPRVEPDGRSSTVRPESPTGKLFGLDVYESDVEPAVLRRGSSRRLRVIEGVPPVDGAEPATRAARPSRMLRRLLGEAPVEEDGSFHIDVPADLPVQLQLLDEDGMAVASCDWIWVKQREFRGCIGCHEDPELTPPNRFVEAARRPATELTLPPERRRTVTFLGQVVPVLRARCQSCHRDAAPPSPLGRLDEAGGPQAAYESLLGAVRPGSARSSPLIRRLLGRDGPGRPAETEASAPTDHSRLLGEEERRVLIEWVDLGAQWGSDTNPGGGP